MKLTKVVFSGGKKMDSFPCEELFSSVSFSPSKRLIMLPSATELRRTSCQILSKGCVIIIQRKMQVFLFVQ